MSEILTNIRAVKVYAYESFLGKKVAAIRQEEIDTLRSYGVMRASINSIFDFVPVLAVVRESRPLVVTWDRRPAELAVTFITYALTDHDLSPSIIFPALQYFGIISESLKRVPVYASHLVDAKVAVGELPINRQRLSILIVRSYQHPPGGQLAFIFDQPSRCTCTVADHSQAEELQSSLHIVDNAANAIEVTGDFQFDSVNAPDVEASQKSGEQEEATSSDKSSPPSWFARIEHRFSRDTEVEAGSAKAKEDGDREQDSEVKETPFALRDIGLHIPRGALNI